MKLQRNHLLPSWDKDNKANSSHGIIQSFVYMVLYVLM